MWVEYILDGGPFVIIIMLIFLEKLTVSNRPVEIYIDPDREWALREARKEVEEISDSYVKWLR